MKVTANLKAKKYDEAILIAEEMKSEAETDGEVLLSEIDIAIANMMKGSGNKGASSSVDLKALIYKLSGSNEKDGNEPSFESESILPTEHALYQNYPNPFNPVTTIKYDISSTSNVKLNIYNTNGQLVANIINETVQAGKHSVKFDGSKLNSGVYIYNLQVGNKSFTKKLVLIK